jgi:CubicO group peptidase (beta-lactamase class C family)
MTRTKKILLGAAAAGVVLLALAAAPLRRVGLIGSGYAAKRLCSGVFLAGRDAQEVWEVDLSLLPTFILSYSIDEQEETATSTGLGVFSQTAAYRPGLGCALTLGTSVEEVRAMGFDEPRAAPPADALWPEGQRVDTASAPEGVDRARLDAALARAFAEPGEAPTVRTRAVVVVYRGRIVAERYAPGFSAQTRLLSWSMAKSVVNALVGVLVRRGELDLAAPAPLARWRGGEGGHEDITLEHLMRMSSGLGFSEVYGAFGDATEMLFMSHSAAGYAAAKPVAHAPGERWSYSSGDTNILSEILRERVGDDAAYHRLPRAALFDVIGASSAVFETDPSGTFVGSSFVYMTARDWARFGLLYLRGGVWQGERVLPEGWVSWSCEVTPGTPQGEYGAQFWLNRGAEGDPSDRRFPSSPRDVCAAQGFERQLVAFVPSRDVVIVRLGVTRPREAFDPDTLIADVLAAIPSE